MWSVDHSGGGVCFIRRHINRTLIHAMNDKIPLQNKKFGLPNKLLAQWKEPGQQVTPSQSQGGGALRTIIYQTKA